MVWLRDTAALRVGIGLLGAVVVGCFVGDAANGLPCDQDDDCGLGIACEMDEDANLMCCGGSCDAGFGVTSSTTTASTEPSATMSTTDMSTTTTTSTTTMAESSTTSGLCGNGDLDEGEECDNPANPNCMDCAYISDCGNGVRDPGEICDVWGDDADWCPPGCTELVLLEWSSDDPISRTPPFCDDDAECDRWITTRENVGDPIVSGLYYEQPSGGFDAALMGAWPEATLRSSPFDIRPLEPHQRVSVTFAQKFAFNDSLEELGADHGVVVFEPEGGRPEQWVRVAPRAVNPGSFAGLIDCSPDSGLLTCLYEDPTGLMGPNRCDNPDPDGEGYQVGYVLGDEDALLNQDASPTMTEASFQSDSPLSGTSGRLLFRLLYDCGNSESGVVGANDNAWQLFDVKVAIVATD